MSLLHEILFWGSMPRFLRAPAGPFYSAGLVVDLKQDNHFQEGQFLRSTLTTPELFHVS